MKRLHVHTPCHVIQKVIMRDEETTCTYTMSHDTKSYNEG